MQIIGTAAVYQANSGSPFALLSGLGDRLMGLRHTGHCVTIAERDTYTSDLEARSNLFSDPAWIQLTS